MPVSQFKTSLKLPPRKTGDMLAIGEVLELGQVSCSSAELPISADLAGPVIHLLRAEVTTGLVAYCLQAI